MKKNELLTKKIEEHFQNKEEFYKIFKLKEETYKKRMKEGRLYLRQVFQTKELLHLTKEETSFLFFEIQMKG